MITVAGYEINEKLYSGNYSSVYQGIATENNQDVVIKVRSRARAGVVSDFYFNREFELGSLVKHPRIINYITTAPWAGGVALIQEYFEGIRLNRIITSGGLPVLDFLKYAIFITEGLVEIHRRNIIHKDIKPSNILLNIANDELKIIDFGSAEIFKREAQPAQEPGKIEGTLLYMSPEQTGRMNRPVDFRSDFYSLGITFYELLTGRPPFHSNDELELIHFHIARRPTPPAELKSSIPVKLSNVILTLLAKEAEDRYQSASGLLWDLQEIKKGLETKGDLNGVSLRKKDYSSGLHLSNKLYGRERERERLLNVFEDVSAGSLELVFVRGLSGVGKSALVHEIYKPVLEKRGYFISGKFDQFNRSRPYYALNQAFEELVAHFLTESERDNQALKNRVLAKLKAGARVLSDFIPNLSHLLGPRPPVAPLPPREAQERLIQALQDFLEVVAGPRSPLVIFFDDMQWVDEPTLEVLESLFTRKSSGYIMIIAAYRDNEVDALHPLSRTLEKLRKIRGPEISLALRPLEREHITAFVKDTLLRSENDWEELSALLYEKTGGNPFFLGQFFYSLYEEGQLHYSDEQNLWSWDIEKIRDLDMTDNVLNLMVGRIEKLSETTRNVLKFAACIGDRFELSTLSVVYEKSPAETMLDLREARQEGLIQEGVTQSGELNQKDYDNIHFQFLHDRVRQAVVMLVEENLRQELRLRIGRLLLKQYRRKTDEAKASEPGALNDLFDLVGHLNFARELLASDRTENDDEEWRELARLNLLAARQARAASAFQSAYDYIHISASMCQEDYWERHYELVLNVYEELVVLSAVVGESEQSENAFRQVIKNAQKKSDKVNSYFFMSAMLIDQGEYKRACELGRQALAESGIGIPREGDKDALKAANDVNRRELEEALESKQISELAQLPEMPSGECSDIIRLLLGVWNSSFYFDPEINTLATLITLNLTLKHGIADASAFGFANFGAILVREGRYQSAYEFAKLAVDFSEKYVDIHIRGKVYNNATILVYYFGGNLDENLTLYKKAFDYNYETRNVTFMNWALMAYVWCRFIKGDILKEVLDDNLKYSAFIGKSTELIVIKTMEFQKQMILALAGETKAIDDLDDENFNTAQWLESVRVAGFSILEHWFYGFMCQLHYLNDNFHKALEAARQAEKLAYSNGSVFWGYEYRFYHALTLTALFEEFTDLERMDAEKKLSEFQETFRQWSQSNENTFGARRLLIEAEVGRIHEDFDVAESLYERSLEAAEAQRQLPVEAIANELLANFYTNRKRPRPARMFLKESLILFRFWGATARVTKTEASHDDLLGPRLRFSDTIETGTTFDETSEKWDLESVLRASRAIAGEIKAEVLPEIIMKIIIENAGAEKGYLLLKSGDSLKIEVAFMDGELDRDFEQAQFSSEYKDLLPGSILRYVMRTGEDVYFSEWEQPGKFSEDTYIKKNKPRSLLCMPIRRIDIGVGVLYLENNLASNVFTKERIRVLRVLLAQAAISLDNARIYDHLEEQVKRRTGELEEIHKKLVEAAHRAGMAEVASNMLHNVGNVLNSAGVPAELIKETLNENRLVSLERACKLLELNADNLPEFLTQDKRGRKFPDFLRVLYTQLQEEREGIKEKLERVLKSVNHIKEIIRLQQSYAGGGVSTAPLSLQELIEDALQIHEAILERYKIKITRNFQSIPEIKSSRHKLMMIVVNLVKNAQDSMIEYNHPDNIKELKVVLKLKNPGLAVIEVSDTGSGISEENIKMIFRHGFTTKKKGHGFGLHSCAVAASEIGADLKVTSEGYGKGATFILEIPGEFT